MQTQTQTQLLEIYRQGYVCAVIVLNICLSPGNLCAVAPSKYLMFNVWGKWIHVEYDAEVSWILYVSPSDYRTFKKKCYS